MVPSRIDSEKASPQRTLGNTEETWRGYRNYPSGSWGGREENGQGRKILGGAENMTKDPVCGIQVDDKNAEFQTQHGGKKYSFCSEDCKRKFEQHPEQYAQTAA